MRGGSYRVVNGKRERLDRETGEYQPCNERGEVIEAQTDEVEVPAVTDEEETA